MKISPYLLLGIFCFASAPFASVKAETAQISQNSTAQQQAPKKMVMTREHLQEIYFDAARQGRSDIIEGLISQGFGPNIHDKKGDTPLILAAYYDHLDTVNLLIAHGAEACGKDLKGNTALMGAAFKGESEIVRRLSAGGCPVNTQNDVGQTALMMASLFGRMDTVKTLLSLGADPTLKDAAGQSALSLAQAQDNEEMVTFLQDILKKWQEEKHPSKP